MLTKSAFPALLVTALAGAACCAQSGVVFSENFDLGALRPGASLTEPPLSWTLVTPNDPAAKQFGEVKLGSGEHGWRGSYIQGGTAAPVPAEVVFMKYFPSVSDGVVVLTFKAFAAGATSDDCTVGLCSDTLRPPRVMWSSTPAGWQLLIGRTGPDGAAVYVNEAFPGGHDTTVYLKLCIDTAHGKVWGKATWLGADGKEQDYETALYDCDPSLATVSGVVITIDRRSERSGMDIDELVVLKENAAAASVAVRQRGWRDHVVRQRAGKGKEVRLPAKLEMVSEDLNHFMAVPYLAYLPEKNRLLLLVGSDYPHCAETLTSDDLGLTWTPPKRVDPATGGLGIGLTNLDSGRLMLNLGGKHWFSNDFGTTWGSPLDVPPCSNGRGWYEWDPPLVDFDKQTGKVKRLLSYSTDNHETHTVYPEGHFLGYVRFSDDEGRTWRDEIKVPEMYAVNEAAFVRAANGDIVASCRTDNPDRFRTEIDHYGGLAVCISKDNGLTWSPKNWLYEWGRHHPCMVLLPDGTLVMTYVVRRGYIDAPDGYPQFGIEAIVSRDDGKSWDLDHKYILHAWKGNRKGQNAWWASSQATSTVLLPDGSLVTAFGTGYRSQPGADGMPRPRDVGLVRWRLNTKRLAADRTLRDAPYDSDLRNQFDPAPDLTQAATPKGRRNVALAAAGAQVTASAADKAPASILYDPYLSVSTLNLLGVPAWLEIRWAKPQKVNEVVLYAGDPADAGMPSGVRAPLAYRLQYEKSGGWADLVGPVTRAEATVAVGAEAPELTFVHTFKPLKINAIRLTVSQTSDTGRRMASPDTPSVPPEKRETAIRRIEVFGP
jgi:hypothetical protein